MRDIRATFDIPNSPQSPDIGQNENCHNTRTSNDTDMKLGPVTKLDKRNKKKKKKMMMMTSCRLFVANLGSLEQSRSRIWDAQSVKPTFSLTATFYLTKTENRTKKSLTQLSHYCLE